ncbi:DNA topoisomerase 2-beta [Dermatophagoides farinae]|uniref:DNA topoisomerase (ATP-hydrolyzing) n=1 Tax=Dermatophagoides farinae TaxID=6954 RepID=A0A922I720_DERFA|nr:DNA topoisomerase 2-beta [Dermatophagoides farinae]
MNSLECTLIVAEGDSAHMIVNSGISVVNRNKFGIFPLNGKFINVREANKKQIMGNRSGDWSPLLKSDRQIWRPKTSNLETGLQY